MLFAAFLFFFFFFSSFFTREKGNQWGRRDRLNSSETKEESAADILRKTKRGCGGEKQQKKERERERERESERETRVLFLVLFSTYSPLHTRSVCALTASRFAATSALILAWTRWTGSQGCGRT